MVRNFFVTPPLPSVMSSMVSNLSMNRISIGSLRPAAIDLRICALFESRRGVCLCPQQRTSILIIPYVFLLVLNRPEHTSHLFTFSDERTEPERTDSECRNLESDLFRYTMIMMIDIAHRLLPGFSQAPV